MDYKSQHSGAAIDKAVADIQSVDLQKLNHYLGIFSDLGTRPVRGKQAGDYCHVGVSTDCDEHQWNGHAWTIAQRHLNLVGEVNNIVQQLGDNPRVAVSQMAISQIIRDIVAVDDAQTRNITVNTNAIVELQKVAEALNALTAEHSNTISEHSNTLANHQQELDDHSQVLEDHQAQLVNHAESISSLNEDIARIDATDTEQQEQIDSNTNRVASVEDRSSALERQTTELNARTSELENKSIRYKGVFADASLLPTDAMAGDYAYVGKDTTALAVYTFGASWTATGEIVDLATVSNLDNIMPAEPSEHRAPTTALLASELATQKTELDAKLTELESNTEAIQQNVGALEYPEYDRTKSYKKGEVVRFYNVLVQFLNDCDAGVGLEGNVTAVSIKRLIQDELNFDKRIRNNAILPLLSSGEITIGAKLTDDKPISYADAGLFNGYTNGFGGKRLLKSITYVSNIGPVRITEATIASDNTVVMKEIAFWNEDTQGVVKNVELNYMLGDNTAVVFCGAFAYSTQSYEGQILLKNGELYDNSLQNNAILFQEHYAYEGSFSELTKEQTVRFALKNNGDFLLDINNSPNLISGYYTISNGALSLNHAYFRHGFKCAEVKLYGAAMTITFEGTANVPIAIIKKKDGTLKSLGTTGGKVHYITDAEILYVNFFGAKEEYTKEFYLTGKKNIDSERYNNRSISSIHSVNLLNHITKFTGKYIDTLGEEQDMPPAYPDVYCSDYIAVNAGDIVEFSLLLKTGTENTILGSLYNANKEKIYNDVKDIIELNGYNAGNGLLYIPYGVKYMRLNCGSIENRGNYLYINRERAYSSLLKDKKISYLGDSITYGATLEFHAVQRYSTVIEKIHNTNTQNIAVSGATTARVERLPSVLSQVDNVDDNADIVVIFSGTNDYWQKKVNIGELSESNTDDTTFVGAMNTIIRNLQAKLIGKTIVWVFPFSQQWQGQNTNTDHGYGTFRQFRDAAKWVCESNSIPMLDLYGNSGMNIANIDSVKSLYTNDGVHPNIEGQYRLAVLISDFLTTLVI